MRTPIKKEPRYDKLGRRHRKNRLPTIDPKTGKHINIKVHVRDVPIIEAPLRHGGCLPMSYIHEHSNNTCYKSTQHRLPKLSAEVNVFRGEKNYKSPLLDVPQRQFSTSDEDSNQLMYSTSLKGEEFLIDCGHRYIHTPNMSNSIFHDSIRACVTSSIELASKKSPEKYRVHLQDEILDPLDQPPIFEVPYALAKSGKAKLRPDGMLRVDNLTERKAVVPMIEIDLVNEQLKRSDTNVSIEQKLMLYREFIGRGLYKTFLNVPSGCILLFLTTNETHRKNVLELSREVAGKPSGFNWLWTKTIPGWDGFDYTTPPLMYDLLTEPYYRADGSQCWLDGRIDR